MLKIALSMTAIKSLLIILSLLTTPQIHTSEHFKHNPPSETIQPTAYLPIKALSSETQDLIFEISEDYLLEPELIIAVLGVETGDTYNTKLRHVNSNGSIDRGIAQINNRYQNFYADLAGISPDNFDPFNKEHAIKANAAGLAYYRDYWITKNIPSTELFYYVVNSYNMGCGGFTSYVSSNSTIHRAYSKSVLKRYQNLTSDGQLPFLKEEVALMQTHTEAKQAVKRQYFYVEDNPNTQSTFAFFDHLSEEEYSLLQKLCPQLTPLANDEEELSE